MRFLGNLSHKICNFSFALKSFYFNFFVKVIKYTKYTTQSNPLSDFHFIIKYYNNEEKKSSVKFMHKKKGRKEKPRITLIFPHINLYHNKREKNKNAFYSATLKPFPNSDIYPSTPPNLSILIIQPYILCITFFYYIIILLFSQPWDADLHLHFLPTQHFVSVGVYGFFRLKILWDERKVNFWG